MAEMFATDNKDNPLTSRAYRKWLLLYASPVWPAYLVIFLVAILTLVIDPTSTGCETPGNFIDKYVIHSNDLTVLTILWSSFSAFFFYRQAMCLDKWIAPPTPNRSGVDGLPLDLVGNIEDHWPIRNPAKAFAVGNVFAGVALALLSIATKVT